MKHTWSIPFYWNGISKTDWQDIPLNTGIFFGSDIGQSGHGSPFFILRNNIYGGYFICHMGWSANWKAAMFTDFRNDRHTHETSVKLCFEIMPVSPPPARLIQPGETVRFPEVHFGMSHDDLDSIIQSMHTYLRKFVMRKTEDGSQPVIYNHAGYMHPTPGQPDISEEGLKKEIDIAAEIGAELFMVDAGWYTNKGLDWWNTTGHWYAGDCLPNDFFPVFSYARQKGLKYGLWVEIESSGANSELTREHPDWFISRYGNKIDRVLDLAKPKLKIL